MLCMHVCTCVHVCARVGNLAPVVRRAAMRAGLLMNPAPNHRVLLSRRHRSPHHHDVPPSKSALQKLNSVAALLRVGKVRFTQGATVRCARRRHAPVLQTTRKRVTHAPSSVLRGINVNPILRAFTNTKSRPPIENKGAHILQHQREKARTNTAKSKL